MSGFSLTNRSGAAFPSDPSGGDIWFHAGRKVEYYWDDVAGLWLSTTPFTLDFAGPSTSLAVTATRLDIITALSPWSGQYDIFAVDVSHAGYLTATGSWTAQLRSVNAGTASAAIAPWTLSTPIGEWVPSGPIAIGQVIATDVELIQFGATKISGAATFYGTACLRYRLVG